MLEKRPGKRSAPYHHGDLRDALVRAARTILEKKGLAALSLRGVARAAGVSPAAPYHHFADKQALLDAVAAQGFDALRSAMEKRMAKKTDPIARLDASGVGYVLFAIENPALFRLMFGGAGQVLSANASLMEARDRAYGVLQAAVAATSPDGAAEPPRLSASLGACARNCQIDPRRLRQARRLWPDQWRGADLASAPRWSIDLSFLETELKCAAPLRRRTCLAHEVSVRYRGK